MFAVVVTAFLYCAFIMGPFWPLYFVGLLPFTSCDLELIPINIIYSYLQADGKCIRSYGAKCTSRASISCREFSWY